MRDEAIAKVPVFAEVTVASSSIHPFNSPC